MASSLYLHIGTHKTGTSSVQRYLSSAALELLTRGVLYPTRGRPDNAPEGHHLLPWAIREASGKEMDSARLRCWVDVFEEIDVLKPRQTIISSEVFDGCSETEVYQVSSLTQEYDTKIVLYLRNHLHFMISAYKQQLKSGRHGLTFRGFLQANIERCNYPALINRWQNHFGRENVIIRVYDKQRESTGIVGDILNVFGLELQSTTGSDERTAQWVNISPRDDVIKMVRFINNLERWSPARYQSVFQKVRRATIREKHVGAVAMLTMKPLLQRPLFSLEDVLWFKKETESWTALLCDEYLDPEDHEYFEI